MLTSGEGSLDDCVGIKGGVRLDRLAEELGLAGKTQSVWAVHGSSMFRSSDLNEMVSI